MASSAVVKPDPGGLFQINRERLAALNQDQMTKENFETLKSIGGVAGLAKMLHTDLDSGLSSQEAKTNFNDRSIVFGSNVYPQAPPKTIFQLAFAAFSDPMLIVLTIASAISLVVGTIENPKKGWIEGLTIFISVLLVVFVTAFNNYSKEKQFRKLNEQKEKIQVKVLRDGKQDDIPVAELQVGDIVVLATGDKIPADLVFIEGHEAKSNESSLTGEPDDISKSDKKDPFLLSGCMLTSGQCKALCIAVGPDSRWGRIKSKLTSEAEPTPLMEKLEKMAKGVGYVGMAASLLTFSAMLIRYFSHSEEERKETLAVFLVRAFITAVTVVVVAVPEGLPLAVTVSLAYSTQKMLQDNNLIRVLAACETMGNATNICSDKTGTLTENRMTVVAGYFDGQYYPQGKLPTSLPLDLKTILEKSLSINSSAILKEKGPIIEVNGNKTEGALLLFLRSVGIDYEKVRKEAMSAKGTYRIYPFSSEKKQMASVLKNPQNGGHILYCKGASEIVLKNCNSILDKNGNIVALTTKMREDLNKIIITMAGEALRTIGVAHKEIPYGAIPDNLEALDTPPDSEMVLDAIFGIIDPLRPDVVDAVNQCQKAGIMVRMVTGDNIHTASAIAKQCGILTAKGLALEGPSFRKMPDSEIEALLPRLQVLARSSPDDKFKLVTLLKKTGEVVGVTGDGTNDAPALKAADVGLSMGLSGTEVAKEASAIVIMDDRFFSIRQAVLWGRCVYDNIRKFLQFQLTVNVVALCVTFIAACADFEPPLNAVMMLWVNLIMDTMGALALGTEEPTIDLLNRRPYKRSARLLDPYMIRNIAVQSGFQLTVQLLLIFKGSDWFQVPPGNECVEYYDDEKRVCMKFDYRHFSIVFCTFVFCQIFNEINSRSIGDKWNVFQGFFTNRTFVMIVFITTFLQVLLTQFGGDFVKTSPLSAEQWLIAAGLGSIALPLGVLMRFIPVPEDKSSYGGYDISILR